MVGARVRLAFVALLVLLAASACGGDSAPLGVRSRPCLERLGEYLHHTREPTGIAADPTPRLPVLDPEAPAPVGGSLTRLRWPDDLQEYGEISYPSTQPGANAVQILIFADDELPKRILAFTRRAVRDQSLFFISTDLRRIGQTLLMWSSTPTSKQRDGVRGCLES
jgi:hypothetical protein